MRSLALITFGVALTACGGGGGGGGGGSASSAYTGPTDPVAMTTETEADQVVGGAYTSATSTPVGNVTGLAKPAALTASPEWAVIGRVLQERANEVTNRRADRLTRAAQTETVQCPNGGSVTGTATTADPNANALSVGDSLTMTFSNCVDTHQKTLNGTVTMTKMAQGWSFECSRLQMTDQSPNATYASLLFDGDFALESQSYPVRERMTGTSIAIVADSEQELWTDFDMSYSEDSTTWDSSYSYNFTVASSEIGGEITVTTNIDLVRSYADQYPSSGELVVTGANTAKVKLTVDSNTSVTLSYDVNPVDGTYESNQSKAWADL